MLRLRALQLAFSRLYYEIAFASLGGAVEMFNFGLAPASEAARADPAGALEPFQAELYLRAWRMADRAPDAALRLVELSSGRGGGLAMLRRLSGGRVLGLERSVFGRRRARRVHGLATAPFNPPRIDLPDASVDVFVCVEAAHNYMTRPFLAEVARCLAPGGVLAIADCPLAPFSAQRARVGDLMARAGLSVTAFEDVTAQALAACRADTPRKLALAPSWPPALRRTLVEALGCEGGDKVASFADGRRGYYLARAVKPS